MKWPISHLPTEVIEEILSRVPLTSLRLIRSTCKTWNALCKSFIIGRPSPRKQFLGFATIGPRAFSMTFNVQGILEDEIDGPSMKQISMLTNVEISNILHCDGLLLCVTTDPLKLLLWNPYLAQKRRIEPVSYSSRTQGKTSFDMYALGYDSKNHNHKILRFLVAHDNYYSVRGVANLFYLFEIYDFSSSSWISLDVTVEWDIWSWNPHGGVSLKGNTYFLARKKITHYGDIQPEDENSLLCFDFTADRFGRRLPLPFDFACGSVLLSSVRDEQLVVLYGKRMGFNNNGAMEFWITTRVKPDEISWSKFFNVDVTWLRCFVTDFKYSLGLRSFFFDEDEKAVVVFDARSISTCYHKACIIKEDKYTKSVYIQEPPPPLKEETDDFPSHRHIVFSSYTPSLVQP